jgi:hypothetical protein
MKTLRLLALCAFFALLGHAATISISFGYNFVGAVACSATVTTNCWNHFEVGTITTVAGVSTFTTLTSIPLPATTSGTVNGITGTFTQNSVFGLETLGFIMVANDGGGNRIISNPTSASVSVSIQPEGPINPSASVTP